MGNWFTDGGIVMYPLVGCGVATLVLIGERSRFWWRLLQRQIPFTRHILLQYRQDPLGVAAELRQTQDLPIARIFWAALSLDRPTPQEFRLALEAAAQGELQNLRRYQTAFDTIVNIAPLLGLLGTILGLMRSFSALPLGNLAAGAAGVSSGIGEALGSTATGLVVAMVALVGGNTFRSLAKRQMRGMGDAIGQWELLYRSHYEKTAITRGEDPFVISG